MTSSHVPKQQCSAGNFTGATVARLIATPFGDVPMQCSFLATDYNTTSIVIAVCCGWCAVSPQLVPPKNRRRLGKRKGWVLYEVRADQLAPQPLEANEPLHSAQYRPLIKCIYLFIRFGHQCCFSFVTKSALSSMSNVSRARSMRPR